MEDKIVEILVQGGLAGVAILSLWVNYKITSNHINHATDSSNRLEIAITKLTDYLITRDK